MDRYKTVIFVEDEGVVRFKIGNTESLRYMRDYGESMLWIPYRVALGWLIYISTNFSFHASFVSRPALYSCKSRSSHSFDTPRPQLSACQLLYDSLWVIRVSSKSKHTSRISGCIYDV